MKYMDMAVKDALTGIQKGEGGPFGALVLKDDQVISIGHNTVLKDNDPTAHAEINAIRQACQKLNTYDLKDCVLFATSEPCPMCLSAIIWSNIKTIYFGTNRKEVANIGFRDDFIYNYLDGKEKNILKIENIKNVKCEDLLKKYNNTIY